MATGWATRTDIGKPRRLKPGFPMGEAQGVMDAACRWAENVLLLERGTDRKLFTAPQLPPRSFTGNFTRFFTKGLYKKSGRKARSHKKLG